LSMLDRPTTTADRADFDLNQKAVRFWSLLAYEIHDLRGRPLAAVQSLGNPNLRIDVERPRKDGPRLVMFQGPGISRSWKNLGPPSAEGKDLVELIMWLGGCERPVARDFLRSLVNRVVSVEAA
jgi:hypothetical protein